MSAKKKSLYVGDIAALGIIILSVLGIYDRYFKDRPQNWMIVDAVNIPDHKSGDDPLIVYDRDVVQPFHATWIASVFRLNGDDAEKVCEGSGENDYSPEVRIGQVHLYDWYLQTECPKVIGDYVIKTKWITSKGVIIRNTSNVYRIIE